MSNLKEVVSKRLQKVIEETEISQVKFSQKCGISKDTVSKAITKKGTLSVKNALLIASACGVSLDYLYGNSEIINIPRQVFSILSRHVLPGVSLQKFHDNAYIIPTVKMLKCFTKYLDDAWAAQQPSTPVNVREFWLQQAADDLLAAIQSGTESECTEFVLVPLHLLKDETLLNDLGINPKDSRG